MKGLITSHQAIGHFRQMNATPHKHGLSLQGVPLPDILFSAVQRGELAQTHYVFPASNPLAYSIQVNLRNAEGACQLDFGTARRKWAIEPHRFPYGLTESEWWEYCLAPHSYVSLEAGQCQVGLNLFNRFLHLDLRRQSAQLVDPGVGNEMLSTTNSFNPQTGELWFASWPVEGTVRRMLYPQNKVTIAIWRLSIRNRSLQQVWRGDFADSLHQLTISADQRFLILAELGVHPVGCASPTPRDLSRDKIYPSKILVLDLMTNRCWRLPLQTAAHVEFDPEDPEICYVSEHNIGQFGVNVGIVGPGRILKYRFKQSGPELLGQFSADDFYRITTHIVFRHREKMLVGVTGYPNTVFLIDAATMKLYMKLEMDAGEKIDITRCPHICREESYGIGASQDGEAIFVAGTGFVRMAIIADGRFGFEKKIDSFGGDSHFTGHLGMLYCTSN